MIPPETPDISITAESVYNLSVGLNPQMAAGPNELKPIILQTSHKELASVLQLIFQIALDTGKLVLGQKLMFPQIL